MDAMAPKKKSNAGKSNSTKELINELKLEVIKTTRKGIILGIFRHSKGILHTISTYIFHKYYVPVMPIHGIHCCTFDHFQTIVKQQCHYLIPNYYLSITKSKPI
jgi:hypothetical protein